MCIRIFRNNLDVYVYCASVYVYVLCLRPSGKNCRMCARSLKISRYERPAALREEQTTRVSLGIIMRALYEKT